MSRAHSLGFGLAILISLAGCATKNSTCTTRTTESKQEIASGESDTDPSALLIQAEIRKYHAWLSQTGRLLSPGPPYDPDGTKFKKWRVDPKTGKRLPDLIPEVPSPDEIKKRLEQMLSEEMPAGSSSPCPS